MRQIENVRNGRSESVGFSGYTGPRTDEKIKLLDGLAGVREVLFDRTDLTDAGLARISTMPNVKRLAIFGNGITDRGLEAFSENKSVECLVLVNTAISDKSARLLSTFQSLNTLVLFNSRDEKASPQQPLSGLHDLCKSRSLRLLKMGGPWVAKEGDLRGLMSAGGNEIKILRIDRTPTSDDDDLFSGGRKGEGRQGDKSND
jgi:hypothetical protein